MSWLRIVLGVAACSVLATVCGPVLAQEEGAPAEAPPPPPPTQYVAIGAVEWESEDAAGQAPAVAIRDELPRKLAAAAPPHLRIVPLEVVKRAASALEPPIDVGDWGSTKAAGERLPYDVLVLVSGQCVDQLISARWQIHDASGGQGTMGAGHLPGHMVDLDGFITSLARRVAEAMGEFDPTRLRSETRAGITESNDAYTDYYLGRALLAGDLAEAATASLAAALERDPGLVQAQVHLHVAAADLAEAAREAGQLEEAVAIAEPALQALWGSDQLEAQIRLLETLALSYAAMEQAPRARDAELMLAEVLVLDRHARTALAILEGLIQAEHWHPRMPMVMASALRQSEDWAAARRILEEAYAEDPSSAALALELGSLLLDWAESLREQPATATQRQDIVTSAVEVLRRASQLAEGSPEILARLGEALQLRGQLDEARTILTQAIEAGGSLTAIESAEARLALAQVELAAGNSEPALARAAEVHQMLEAAPLRQPAGSPLLEATTNARRLWADLGLLYLGLNDATTAQKCLGQAEVRFGPHSDLGLLRQALAPPAEPAEATQPEE
ncbi:MAG: tetratricopeptide repeat protein [Armatimonadia bacterium]|nr:tetratricopeptide repeat protein [Armatimonadia bacterium]